MSYEVRDENNYNKLSPVRTRRLSSKIATTLQLSTLIVIGEEMLLVTVICNFANCLQSETTLRSRNN